MQTNAADLADKAFNTSNVNVKVRDKVVWTNNDPVIHTIVEGSDGTSFNYNLRSN